MKVMFIPPENDSNRYLSSLAAELEEQSVEVIDFTWNSLLPLLGPMRTTGRPEVIHIHWLNSLVLGSTFPRTVVKGLRLLFELMVLKLLGISIVWTVHNVSSHEQRYPRWERGFRMLFSRRFANHLIAHCRSAEETIREAYRLDSTVPITVIPHGNYIGKYPRNISRADARDGFDLGPDELVYAFFGRIRPYKQAPYLVETFKCIDEDATLIVAGNPSTKSLRRTLLKKSEDSDDVETKLEFVPDEEVSRYFEAADVIVLPYQDILTSGSAILAMSLACPVIAPQIGCLSKLIDDGIDGFFYDPNRSDGLKRAMERAIEADLPKMGDRGCEKAAKLDWGTIAMRTVTVYKRTF
jgi:glycosyltransferase involved in cell wall biosynthesis